MPRPLLVAFAVALVAAPLRADDCRTAQGVHERGRRGLAQDRRD